MSEYPKLCRDCKWGQELDNSGSIRCSNPIVNANDQYALSSPARYRGTSAMSERGRVGWFVPCGKKGRQWERAALGDGNG